MAGASFIRVLHDEESGSGENVTSLYDRMRAFQTQRQHRRQRRAVVQRHQRRRTRSSVVVAQSSWAIPSSTVASSRFSTAWSNCRHISKRCVHAQCMTLTTMGTSALKFKCYPANCRPHLQRFDRQPCHFPYTINRDKIIDTRGECQRAYSVRTQFNSEERWTKAMKYMLINMKWALAYIVIEESRAKAEASE